MNATDISRKVAAGMHALEAVGKIAKSLVPVDTKGRGEQAIALVGLIADIADKVSGALAGTVNVGDLEQEVAKLTSDLAYNDALRKARIDARFPQQDDEG